MSCIPPDKRVLKINVVITFRITYVVGTHEKRHNICFCKKMKYIYLILEDLQSRRSGSKNMALSRAMA